MHKKNTVNYKVFSLMLVIVFITFFACETDTSKTAEAASEADIDWQVLPEVNEATGLVMDETFPLIIANCTPCHSAKLITQNQASREGWASMIDWMQATQGLWKFDEHEPQILDYLTKYYGPTETGRRENLTVEWYEL